MLGAKYIGSIATGGTDTHVVTIDIGAGDQATDVRVKVAGFGQTPNGIYTPVRSGTIKPVFSPEFYYS